jgi:hypothetical protein
MNPANRFLPEGRLNLVWLAVSRYFGDRRAVVVAGLFPAIRRLLRSDEVVNSLDSRQMAHGQLNRIFLMLPIQGTGQSQPAILDGDFDPFRRNRGNPKYGVRRMHQNLSIAGQFKESIGLFRGCFR